MSSNSSTEKSLPKKKNVKYEQKFINSWLKDDMLKSWLKTSTKVLLSSQREPYRYCKANSGALKFQVKSRTGSAILYLISKNKPHTELFEIKLQRRSKITDLSNGQEEVVNTPGLELVNFTEFWLTWFGNQICIGLENNLQPLLNLVCEDKTSLIGYVKFETRSGQAPVSNPADWKIEDTPLIPTRPIKQISSASLQWVRFENELPSNAIIGGMENVPLYIARARHAGSLAPGKYRPDTKSTYVAWGRQAHKKTEFEILCGVDVEWCPTKGNQIPLNAVIGGYSEVGRTPLYIGRAYYDGHLLVGKVHTLYSTCYLPYKNREIEVHHYEIMISRSIPTRGTPVCGLHIDIDQY